MTIAPAVAAGSWWQRLRPPVTVIATLSALTVALHVRDPHQQGTWGVCPSAAVGIYCPGCGGLRAVNDLTHGEVGAALSSNVLVTVMLPVVALGLLWWAVDRARGVRRVVPERTVVRLTAGFVVVALCFAVVRNTAYGAWLAP